MGKGVKDSRERIGKAGPENGERHKKQSEDGRRAAVRQKREKNSRNEICGMGQWVVVSGICGIASAASHGDHLLWRQENGVP